MNLNTLAQQVAQSEGLKVSLPIGQIKEVIKIVLAKVGLTKTDIRNKEQLDIEHNNYDKYDSDKEKYGQRVADYNSGFLMGQTDILERMEKHFSPELFEEFKRVEEL